MLPVLLWIFKFFGMEVDMLGSKNLHILLDVDEYQRLRHLSYQLNKPRAALAREAITALLKKYQRKGEIPTDMSIPTV